MKTGKANRTAKTFQGVRSRAGGQKGAVLFIALIVLVAMMLASIALVRSVDTANIIAGNLAFKQATLQAGDFGVEAAATALPILAAAPDTSISTAPGGTPAYWYYSTRRDTDASGVPITREAGSGAAITAINWNNVPVAATVSGNTVKVVIDRLCRGDGTADPITDVEGRCFHEGAAGGRSYAIRKTAFSTVTTVYYRVTAQVTGPRNTVSMVQAVVGR